MSQNKFIQYSIRIILIVMLLSLSGCSGCEFLCGFVTDDDHCAQREAVASVDPAKCEDIERDAPRSKCYVLLAEKTGSIEYCGNITSGFGTYSKEECIQMVAINKKDPSICEQIGAGFQSGTSDMTQVGISGVSKKICLEETTPPEVKAQQGNWSRINATLSRQAPEVNPDDFMTYLYELEAKNPDKDWKEIVAYLHAEEYPHDIHNTVPLFGNDLFKHGAETDGYLTVKPVSRFVPKFTTHGGKKIHLGHSYAGLRSDLNRDGGIGAWTMRNVNTNWGDTYQTWVHWDDAYAPPDQREGNDLGLWLNSYYGKKKNADQPLSKAYRDYFRTH